MWDTNPIINLNSNIEIHKFMDNLYADNDDYALDLNSNIEIHKFQD